MSILKIILYVAPFLAALAVLWVGIGVGLNMDPADGSMVVGTILIIIALIAAALNVGWIVAYSKK